MRCLIVVCLVAIANAIPQGYNYQQPSIQHATHGAGQVGQHLGAGGSIGGHNSGLQGVGSVAAPSFAGIGAGGHHGHGHSQPSGVGGGVSKHFYIHSAPEESEEDALNDSQNAGPKSKKYNVVFIKAPSQSAKAAALALRKAQSEEKTLIYVLTKKLDASDLQAALQSNKAETNKPEVVFIKYKTPEEAAHAQQQIQAEYESLGEGPSHVSDEGVAPISSVIGSLGHSGGETAASGVAAGGSYLPPSF